MPCSEVPTIETISGTECIGDSLPKINNNFTKLEGTACDLYTKVQALSTNTASLSSKFPVTNANIAFDGGAFCFKNKLINAQGLINQRVYVSGTTTTQVNQYTVDRWRVVTSGQALLSSVSQNVVTFTAPAGGVEQVVENLNVESGTYVLNWTGTATATVNGTARTKGETFSLTGGSNVTVRFSSGTFSLPQLEKGNVPTAFEYRPIGTELALCQRYYETTYPSGRTIGSLFNPAFPQAYDGVYTMRFGNSGNSAALFWFIRYAVPKRVIPAITPYSTYTGNAGTCSVFSGALTYYAQYSVSVGSGSPGVTGTFSTQYHLFANIPSPGIPDGYYAQAHFVADAEL